MRRAREARRLLRRAVLLFNYRAAQISPISQSSYAGYSILTGQIEKFSQADKLAARISFENYDAWDRSSLWWAAAGRRFHLDRP